MESYYSVRDDAAKTVVEFQTESLMNPHDIERVGSSLFHLVDVEHRRVIVLDFSRVKYLSSQAIAVVLTLNKKVTQQDGGRLILCGVGPQLLQLLKITRLDRILTVTSTQKEALAVK